MNPPLQGIQVVDNSDEDRSDFLQLDDEEEEK